MDLYRTSGTPVTDQPCWPTEASQLLEEHHLVAWSRVASHRAHFAADLMLHLSAMGDTQVCLLNGSQVRDLAGFCGQLERAIGIDRIEPRIDSPHGVVGALRRRMTPPGSKPIKQRYYIWTDADVLLRADHILFSRLVDCLAGVAAEAEYTSEDMLLLHRAVFVGSPALDVYAEDPTAQFQSWYNETDAEPFWATVTGVASPRFLRYKIGEEVLL